MNITSRINTLITSASLCLDMSNLDGAHKDMRAARNLISDASKAELVGVDFDMLTAVDARHDAMHRAAINANWEAQAEAEMAAGVDR